MKNIITILLICVSSLIVNAQNDTIVYFKNHNPVPSIENADFKVTVTRKNTKNSIMSEAKFIDGKWETVVNRTIRLKDKNTYVVKNHGKSFQRKFNEIPGGYQVEDYNYQGELKAKGIATNLFPLLKHGQWLSYTDGVVTGINTYKNGVLTKSFISNGKKQLWPTNTYANADELAKYKKSPFDLARDVAKNIKYPKECMEKRLGGRVLILFGISETGDPCDIHIFRSVEPHLNKAAAEAVAKCTGWKPAMKDGKPVKVYTIVPVNFQMR